MIKNLVNGKCYVGQSVNIKRRFMEHKNINKESNQSLVLAYKKYGIENFSFSILEECEEHLLNEREMFWIEKLKPEYNRTKGGDGNLGRIVSDETKSKLRTAGKSQWDKKTDDEKERIIRNNLTGPKVGHSVSEETRAKLRAANIGKTQSKDTIEKRAKKLRGRKKDNSKRQKPVICIETGEVFESCKAASEKYNATTLCGHLKGRYKTCKGLHFEYIVV